MAANSNDAASDSPTPDQPVKRRRGPGRPFKPGVSGNPTGMRKTPEEVKLAFEELSLEAIEALRKIIADPKHKRHEQACEYVINRAYGPPRQNVELTGPGGSPLGGSPIVIIGLPENGHETAPGRLAGDEATSDGELDDGAPDDAGDGADQD